MSARYVRRSETGPQRTAGESHSPFVDLREHARAIRRFWRSVALLVLLGIGVAALITFRTAPVYETQTTYFVDASLGGTDSALQADEFAQRRINSYVGLVTSERMAKVIIDDTGLDLQPADVSAMITATVQPETVLLAVVVADTSPDRSRLISQSIARNLDEQIGQLDNRGKTSKVDVSVLSGPTLNPTPVSPRTKLNLAIGLLLGLGLGVAQAILRQQLDTSFQTRDQLAAVTGVPTLGQLSYDRNAKSSPVLTATTGHSRRAETFRQLRTNLRFVDAASPVSVLVVTSAVESEGKTTTAINLALTFAEAGSRVLLIDADLRKPKLENYLDLEASAGLTSVLIGEANVDDVVQDWGAQGLQVLASGPIPPNPSELLGSPTMEKVVAELRSSYDVVVIDSPPLLPVTDAAVTSVQADGVLFVVRHGKTRRDQVLQSMSQLDGVDTRILGTVLSMAPGSRRDNLPNYYQEPAS